MRGDVITYHCIRGGEAQAGKTGLSPPSIKHFEILLNLRQASVDCAIMITSFMVMVFPERSYEDEGVGICK